MLDVGVDVHKRICQACLKDERGSIVEVDVFTGKIAQEAVENPQAKLLMSFTGVDYYSAMLLASEIGDVTRFSSAKKLVSYAGLAPGTRQSADKTIHGHIVREGNKRIRWILVEAAQHASRHDPRLSGFYLRVLKRRGYQRAIVAVGRKMLVAMYHVLSKNEAYHGVRGELFERKLKHLEWETSRSLQAQ